MNRTLGTSRRFARAHRPHPRGSVQKSTMSTPWAGWDEWEEVYALLFAMDDSSARMSGVQHVNVWRLRGNTLPLFVDATATFVELGLLDHAPTPLSEHAQGLMYAMAITRLVNGIVDPMQQASRALSVKRLAQSVGMPMVLVELRHECTHNRMPSLDRLRAAADEALLWLHGHYWLPQRALRVECSDSIHGCLRTYQQAAESRLAATSSHSARTLSRARLASRRRWHRLSSQRIWSPPSSTTATWRRRPRPLPPHR